MRENKYRAWDSDARVFYYFGLKDLWAEGCENQLQELNDSKRLALNTNFPYSECPIEQFTGLSDKNGEGQDVYEGDLFEAIFSNVPDGFELMNGKKKIIPIVAEVVFRFGKFVVKIMHPEYKEYVYTDLFSFLKNEEKVIKGNIHQNPKLLEESK